MNIMSFNRLSRQAQIGALALLSMQLFAAPASSAPSKTSGSSGAIAISPINQPDPTRGSQLNDVAVNANGLTVAAWDQYDYNNGGSASIGIAVQSGGKWGAPCTLSVIPTSCNPLPNNTVPGTVSGFSMNPRVAVGADGTMAVSWIYQDPATLPSPQQKMQVAVKSPTATTWTTTTLAQGPIGGVAITGFVPVAIDANGNVTAAWTLWDGIRHVVQSATMLSGGAWSAPVTLSDPTEDGLYLSLAVNARGDAAVAYTISPYTSYATGTYAAYVSRSGPSGTWSSMVSRPVVVSETMTSSVGYITNPVVALDAGGLATVIYMGYGVEGTRQLNNGSFTAPQSVIGAPNSVSSFQSVDLGVDQNGNAVVAASIFDATINVDRSSVWVSSGTPGGAWSPPQRLTDPSVPVDAYATRVAVSPDGALSMVGWIDHYHGTVQVSKLTNGAWGAANTIGRGTAWSSFQEVLSLDASSPTYPNTGSAVGRAIWKNAKTGTQIYATNVN